MKTISQVLIHILAAVCTYNCEAKPEVPPPDLSAEKKIFDSEKGEEQPKQVHFLESPLYKLDEVILKELLNPKPLAVSSEVKLDVLKNLVEYEKHMKDLYAALQKNTTAGVHLAHELSAKDGPKFLKQELNEENLKKVYNWDDENVEHLNDLFKDIKSVYNNITALVQEKPTPYEIFFSI